MRKTERQLINIAVEIVGYVEKIDTLKKQNLGLVWELREANEKLLLSKEEYQTLANTAPTLAQVEDQKIGAALSKLIIEMNAITEKDSFARLEIVPDRKGKYVVGLRSMTDTAKEIRNPSPKTLVEALSSLEVYRGHRL